MILTGLILGTVLDAFGVISLEASTFPWLGTIIGGFIFGFAIVLAGGCATGTYYRAGEGLVGSWLALIFYMIGATVFRVGPLSGTTDGIRSIETQNGSFQEALGVRPWIFVAILVAVVAVAAARQLQRERQRPRVTLPASKTGLAHLLIGSFIPAKASDAFKIRVPDAQTAVRSIIGGTLMGWGTAWAGGCTIGNAMVNTATFSFQGWTALLFMVLGTGAAAKIFIMRHQGTGSRPPTARSAPSPWWRPSRPWSSCRRVTSSSSTSTAPRPPTRCPSWPPRTATRSPSSSSAAPPNGRSPYRSPEQRRRRLLDWHGHSLTSSSGSNPRMRNHSRSS